MKKDYLWMTGNAFSEMRLLLEGAIVLYEGDALLLYEQADDQQEAKAAFNDIGKALYLMLEQVRTLEKAHSNETARA